MSARKLSFLLALTLLACTPQQPTRAPVKPAASTSQTSACSDLPPTLGMNFELMLVQLPVSIALMSIGLPMGALAVLDLAAIKVGKDPRKATVRDMTELFPETLRAGLEPAMLDMPLLVSPLDKKVSMTVKDRTNATQTLDFNYEVTYAGEKASYTLTGVKTKIEGYEIDFPALSLEVAPGSGETMFSSSLKFIKPGTLSIAGSPRYRIDKLDLPINFPLEPVPSPAPGAPMIFIHPDARYKIFLTQSCYTFENGQVTLQNGKSYPL
jgi:hypothetical protein